MFRIVFFLSLLVTTLAGAPPKSERPAASTPAPAKAPALAAVAEAAPAANAPVVDTVQTSAAPNDDVPSKMVGDFFSSLEKGLIEEAYTNLTKGSKIVERPEDLPILKKKTKEAIDAFGVIQGYELVESKPVGSRLMRRTYVSLGAEYPLRWRFYFYLANNRWRLIDLRVDDRLTGLFDEPKEPDDSRSTKP